MFLKYIFKWRKAKVAGLDWAEKGKVTRNQQHRSRRALSAGVSCLRHSPLTPADSDPHTHSQKLQFPALCWHLPVDNWGQSTSPVQGNLSATHVSWNQASSQEKKTTWWCSLDFHHFTWCFGIQKSSSRCKDCSAPLPGHAKSPGLHVSGCWIWQCSRLSLRFPPKFGQEGGRHCSATLHWCHTQGLCPQGWEVQDEWGAWARHHQQQPGRGCSGELQHQESCSISRAVHRPQLPQHGAPPEDALKESLKKPV